MYVGVEDGSRRKDKDGVDDVGEGSDDKGKGRSDGE